MDFISDEYRRNLAAKSLVLRLLRDGPLSGGEVILRLEAACLIAARAVPGFDFSFWASGGVWENLEQFFDWHFISVTGGRPESPTEWRTSILELTEAGARFLDAAERGAKDILDALGREVPVAAVG